MFTTAIFQNRYILFYLFSTTVSRPRSFLFLPNNYRKTPLVYRRIYDLQIEGQVHFVVYFPLWFSPHNLSCLSFIFLFPIFACHFVCFFPLMVVRHVEIQSTRVPELNTLLHKHPTQHPCKLIHQTQLHRFPFSHVM